MRRTPLLCLLASSACVKLTPPAPVAPRDAMPVRASFGRTWDSVIDHFASRNIAIRTMERASGFIAAEPVLVPARRSTNQPHELADCGSDPTAPPLFFSPTAATYNVVVRGDSAQSTVLVTVRWASTEAAKRGFECTSRGVWENDFERSVKERAERAAAR